MRFSSGIRKIETPNIKDFSFLITGIRVNDQKKVSFYFLAEAPYYRFMEFSFENGFAKYGNTYGVAPSMLCPYNTKEEQSISGYLSGNTWHFKINDVYQFKAAGAWTNLTAIAVSGSSDFFADIYLNSLPISYSVNFAPSYNYYDSLTGNIVSNKVFKTGPLALTFYNSNKALLTGNPTGLRATVGTSNFSFKDVDDSFQEYQNDFSISIPTTFGDIGKKVSTQRTGVKAAPVLYFSDISGNEYYKTSEFEGVWSGSTFSYSDNVLTYNLGFDFSHTSSVGDPYSSVLKIDFRPLSPANMGAYKAQYITGVTMTASGKYSSPPAFSGAQYYYVTGVQNALQSFLFSSGCANSLNVSFAGGSPQLSGSGAMILKTVRLSGIYDTGVRTYKMVSSYSGKSFGSGYRSAPTFSIATGGACYSLPDYSGVNLYQFTRATGYGALYAQAAGLTGLVVMSGSGVSGVQVTNIGWGYDATMPPTLGFIRQTGDAEVLNASGVFGYKTTGTYDFDTFWKAAISFGGGGAGFTGVSGYNGAYSGNYSVSGPGSVQVQLTCSGLDNTSPVSGLLTIVLSGNRISLTGQKIISQSRTFNTDTGALMTPPPPTYLLQPLPDLNYAFDADQFDIQDQSAAGKDSDNIIYF